MANVNERVLKILKTINPIGNFESSSSFLVDGLIDSLDIIKLITLLETEFAISVEALDIVPENFDSIVDIVDLINRKRPEKVDSTNSH
jgi:hypothetical protein